MTEIKALVERVDMDEMVDLVKNRMTWMSHSLVIGGKTFCQNLINRFVLQGMHSSRVTPFPVSNTLTNTRVRKGPT